MRDSIFSSANEIARSSIGALLDRIAPGGHYEGKEYVVTNRRREDRSPGSFKLCTLSGKWADFATGDSGGDFVGFVKYVLGMKRQVDAATWIVTNFGMGARGANR